MSCISFPMYGERSPGEKWGSTFFGLPFLRETVSGAPKIRAMEIIEELEPSRRGFYAGAVGYFSISGRHGYLYHDPLHPRQGWEGVRQAGGGVVADSDPEKEYEETLHKARAILGRLSLRRTDSHDS